MSQGKLEKKLINMTKEKLRGILALSNSLLGSGELLVYFSRNGREYVQLSETDLPPIEREDKLLSRLCAVKIPMQRTNGTLILGLRGTPKVTELDQIYQNLVNAIEPIISEVDQRVKGEDSFNLMQLFRGLIRQYDKERALHMALRFIKNKMGYEGIYFNINLEKMLMIPLVATERKSFLNDGKIYELRAPLDFYKKGQLIQEQRMLEEIFPTLHLYYAPQIVLTSPVFSKGKLVGLLLNYSPRKEIYLNEVRNALESITEEISALFSRIERQNLIMEKILGATSLEGLLACHSAESFQLEEGLQHIYRIITDVTGAKRCLMTLTGEGKQVLFQNLPEKDSIEGLGEVPHTISRLALETKKPVIVYDASTDPRCDFLWAQRMNIFSFVTLPIFSYQGTALGTLTLGHNSYYIFSKEQLRFTELMAQQIGLMISNIQYIGDLQRKARIDGLTGLYNRLTFETLYEEIYDQHKRERRDFTLMMLDIDNFKEVNDQYGHQLGDEILKKVAEKIIRNVRKKDVVARYGGEEVIVLLVDIKGEEAKQIAERIRDAIASFRIRGVGVTVSIGICSFTNCHVEKNQLIQLADQCLYEAKRFGKNHVRCWEPEALH